MVVSQQLEVCRSRQSTAGGDDDDDADADDDDDDDAHF